MISLLKFCVAGCRAVSSPLIFVAGSDTCRDRITDGNLAGAQPACGKIVRPLLDAMQTTPAFVYLVPLAMLFGIGNVPGVVVTILLPPIIRLTITGINPGACRLN